jgi:lipoprotein
MKRFIFTFPVLLLASFIVAGCSKSEEQKNLDKANALLDKKGLPHIEKLDSVKDYLDTHTTFIMIFEYISKIDSMNYASKGRKFTKEEAREVSDWISDMDLLRATHKELYRIHLEKDEFPRFIGYKAEVSKDERGFPVDYYFEKDLSAVQVIKLWRERVRVNE